MEKKEKKEKKIYIPEDLAKLIIKPSNEWKYATTVVREMRALNVGIAFFDRDRANTLASPASPYPERQKIIPRDKLKPR